MFCFKNFRPEELKCYTLDQRDRVLSEILCQANAQIITAARSMYDLNMILYFLLIFYILNFNYNFYFSKEIEDFHTELKDEYQNLSSSVNVLRILATDGTIITGDCKQKSISYYLEEACRILYTWKLYQKSLDISLNRIDMRNSESIIQFKSVTMMPQNLSSNLDRYLLYSIFLYSQK